MAKIEAWLSCDLKKQVQVQGLSGNVFSMDNNGSRINVRIYDNGEKTTVSGSVTANCILADGSTINVNGSLTTDNGQSVAYVDIPQSCLLVPGPIRIAIKLTASGVITTLAAVVTTVYRTQTDIVITPSAQIITDWNAEISAAIATQNAAIANQDTKINDLKSAFDTLDDEVKTKFGFQDTKDMSYGVMDATYADCSGLAKTRRWFLNNIFPAGVYVKSVKFDYAGNATNSRTQLIEIWEKSNDTLTKVKTVSVNTTTDPKTNKLETATAEIDYTAENPWMVCLLPTGDITSAVYMTDETQQDRVLVSTNVTPSTSSLSYEGLSYFTAANARPSVEVDYSVYGKTNVVTIGNGMDYTEIQDALEAITDDAVDNPYMLWVMPKATPYKRFSTIRKLTDAYVTSGRIRYISIIGMDKANCIIRSDSGDYKQPCAEILINGILSNLTFIMTNDEQTATAEKGGYCLHIDFEPTPSAVCNMVIENCDFQNASAPCIGIGLRENLSLTIRNCNMHTTLSRNYSPHEGYRNLYTYGCLFAHTDSGSTTQNQRITIDNCFGLCDDGAKSLNMIHAGSYDQSTADFVYTLLRNVFWNARANAAGYNIDSDLTASAYNFGNNNN